MSIKGYWQDDGSVVVMCGEEVVVLSRSTGADTGTLSTEDGKTGTSTDKGSRKTYSKRSSNNVIAGGAPVYSAPGGGGPKTLTNLPHEPLDMYFGMGGGLPSTAGILSPKIRIAKASELPGIIDSIDLTNTPGGRPALNIEWASNKPVIVHDVMKNLKGRVDGPFSVRIRQDKSFR